MCDILFLWSKRSNKRSQNWRTCPAPIKNRLDESFYPTSRNCAACALKSTKASVRSIPDTQANSISRILFGRRINNMAEHRRSVLWSSDALADLDGIWDYYARVAGSDTANNIIREIGKIIRLIEEHPFAGRSRDEVRTDLRSFAVSPHVVFYRVASNRPEIVRVLDGRQDIDEIFANGEEQK